MRRLFWGYVERMCKEWILIAVHFRSQAVKMVNRCWNWVLFSLVNRVPVCIVPWHGFIHFHEWQVTDDSTGLSVSASGRRVRLYTINLRSDTDTVQPWSHSRYPPILVLRTDNPSGWQCGRVQLCLLVLVFVCVCVTAFSLFHTKRRIN